MAEPMNPFVCTVCGHNGDGSVKVRIHGCYGSDYDTIHGQEYEVCDACFAQLVPSLAVRLWLTNTRGEPLAVHQEHVKDMDMRYNAGEKNDEPAGEWYARVRDGVNREKPADA